MNPYYPFPRSMGIGDLLYRPKALGFVEHCGVSLGNGYVLHNSPERGEEVVSLHTFAANQPVRVQPTNQPTDAVLLRARRVLASPKPWHGTDRNCEHTATDVAYGTPSSPQLAAIVITAAVLIAFAWVATRRTA